VILSGPAIRAAFNRGDITIAPFDAEQLNPASYDLRLGDTVAVYDAWVTAYAEEARSACGQRIHPHDEAGPLDVKGEPKASRFKIGPDGWVCRPGVGYLMHTVERVHTNKYVPVLDGKSSIGRLFVSVHATAGYGDPGFDGQYTLEVTVTHPIRLYAGMRIAQIRFHEMRGTPMLYKGNYVGDASTGPVPSRAWKQF